MTKLSDAGITTLVSLNGNELVYFVDDPSGTPASAKMAIDDALDAMSVARTDESNVFTGSHQFGSVLSNDDTGILVVSGGEATNLGGNVQLYGDAHATDASQIHFREDATTVMVVNDSKVGIGDEDPDAQLKISPLATTYRGLRIDMPTSTTSNCIQLEYNTANRIVALVDSSTNEIELVDFDNGTSYGPAIKIGKNSNATTPIPGALKIEQGDGGNSWLFPDNSDLWRTSNSQPDNASGWASATVVGDQTSNEAYKTVVGPGASAVAALGYMRAAVETARRFVYSDGRYNGEEFDGVIVHNGDGLQRYGKNADPEHDGGKALNEINAIGDLMRVVVAQADQIAELQAQVAELRRK